MIFYVILHFQLIKPLILSNTTIKLSAVVINYMISIINNHLKEANKGIIYS